MLQKIKTPLIIVAIILFLSNMYICDYFYYDNINDKFINKKLWWFLKSDIHRVVILLVSISYVIGSKGWVKFVLELMIGFLVASIYDSNHTKVSLQDILMMVFTVLFSVYDLIKHKKNAI